jgi:hypothetical protein
MMTTVAHTQERVTPRDPWRDPYGSQTSHCFPFTNPLCDPCDPYKLKTLWGDKGHRYSTHWKRQPQRSGGYNGTLGVTGVTRRDLSFFYMGLRVTLCTGQSHASGSQIFLAPPAPSNGSLWGLSDAGDAEPRCFPLKAKIEIENPFYRRGALPNTIPKEPT